jgi:hypothetical protein
MTMGMDRRKLLTGAATLAGAMTAGKALAADTSSERASGATVIEWNMHMFSSNVQKFPFHPKAVYKPDATRLPADPLTAYVGHLNAFGIDKAMFVQPEPYGDDHTLVLDCLQRGTKGRFKGTSLFYPKDPEAPKKLAALVKKEPRIVSTRFHASVAAPVRSLRRSMPIAARKCTWTRLPPTMCAPCGSRRWIWAW